MLAFTAYAGHANKGQKRINMAQYRTLREIANRMGWKSPSTVLRRHKLDDFPVYPDFGRRGLFWVTSDELIHAWEARKVAMNQGARLKQPWKWKHKESYQPYNWQLRKDTGTKKPPDREGKAASLREANKGLKVAAPKKQCTCGTPTLCIAHD